MVKSTIPYTNSKLLEKVNISNGYDYVLAGNSILFGAILSSETGTKVGTWSEQTWQDKCIGTGLWTINDFSMMSCSLYEVSGEESNTALYNLCPQKYQWWIMSYNKEDLQLNRL